MKMRRRASRFKRRQFRPKLRWYLIPSENDWYEAFLAPADSGQKRGTDPLFTGKIGYLTGICIVTDEGKQHEQNRTIEER